MRWPKIVFCLSVLSLSVFFFSPAQGQFGKKGGGNPFGGGGNPFGGGGNPFGGGGFGGGGFGGGGLPGGMMADPSRMFDALAKGRPYFLISETRMLNGPLTQFAQQKGISNGQITREQFNQFSEQMKTNMSQPGGMGFRPGGATPGGGPGGNPFAAGAFQTPGRFAPQGSPFGGPGMGGPGMGGRGASRFEMMNQWADSEFRRLDVSGDGFLNTDEMPEALKQSLATWDTNRDQLIDQNEFRVYFLARLSGGDEGANPVTTIILEEELDKRPTVLRAGKLPKELKWFSDLDLDKDGQVALWEWRRAGKNLDEFQEYDRNDDGFITPEEALRVMSARGQLPRDKAGDGDSDDGTSVSVSRSGPPTGMFNRAGNGEEQRGKKMFGNGDDPRGKNPWSNFGDGKGKKKKGNYGG